MELCLPKLRRCADRKNYAADAIEHRYQRQLGRFSPLVSDQCIT
jgi:hypothetical protein